ncbi:MAG: bifunctional aspartate kinase/homoserine dehydrogenase I [Rickettsiales bacterium TMED269]|nr:bifunctional aspartate kinase/homoserine dehydrogenase I [Gammaproteobacteria bacterium]OUX40576.1 MAG: bifunctional aspartate kinase/homoserine dehydrogenase I [Rickettsiales bacterium TMED269]
MSQKDWQVYKFGGTSMKNADALEQVGNLVTNSDAENLIVVVSAMGGMTDALLQFSETQDSKLIEDIQSLYIETSDSLVKNVSSRLSLIEAFKEDIQAIREIAKLKDHASLSIEENEILGFGEIWTSKLLHAYLSAMGEIETSWLNPMDFLIIQNEDMGANVNWSKSKEAFTQAIQDKSGKVIMGGFIASDIEGKSTNLGRNGSDYSASILGSLSEAKSVTIWTDVDGVLTGDPRVVNQARMIEQMTYDEAIELSYFGAEVIHPKTMAPLMHKEIPLYIRNTFNPESLGTSINSQQKNTRAVKGISTIKDIALLNLEGTGMIGVPGIVNRLGKVLQQANISIVLISQASSEHSICFAVRSKDARSAADVIKQEFKDDFKNENLSAIQIEEDCSILAIVGSGMTGTKGIAARFFNAISLSKTNVIAIAQGSSEKNISIVIKSKDMNHATSFVHDAFFNSNKQIAIGIMGYGSIGQELHKQILDERKILQERENISLDILALSNSQKMMLSEDNIDLKSASNVTEKIEALEQSNTNEMINHISRRSAYGRIIIDCSASDEAPDEYSNIFENGISIVTANKKGLSGNIDRYKSIMNSKNLNGADFLYETTAGAALPFVKSVSDIASSSDSIKKIEGVFSGTLAYLFNSYDASMPFSELVNDALQQGFTEPDPRDDLSGMDVARKLVILAREMGLDMNVNDIHVESLVDPNHLSLSVNEYLEAMSSGDQAMNDRYQNALENNEKLSYVAQIDENGNASVSLKNLSNEHSFFSLKGTENIIAIHSDYYSNYPLVLRGPGAGREVTASGLFFDLLSIIRAQ